MEKLNLTQQKHTFTNQKEMKVQQHKINTKTKAMFSRLLRHPAWKRTGPILVSALHKFVTYLDIYPLTHSSGTHTGQQHKELVQQFDILRLHYTKAQQLLWTADRGAAKRTESNWSRIKTETLNIA